MEPTPLIPNPNSRVQVQPIPLTGRFAVQVDGVAVEVGGQKLFDTREEANAAAEQLRQKGA
jgi:hypothetical protein